MVVEVMRNTGMPKSHDLTPANPADTFQQGTAAQSWTGERWATFCQAR